jgi:hypothetical protein
MLPSGADPTVIDLEPPGSCLTKNRPLRLLSSQGSAPAIPDTAVPTRQAVHKFVCPLDNVVIIGYPVCLRDSVNLLPISLRGITAAPFQVDFKGHRAFLIDAAIFRGSSGGPVVQYLTGAYKDRQDTRSTWEGRKLTYWGASRGPTDTRTTR